MSAPAAAYTGRLDLGTTIDLEKVMGWTGATFHANMFQIHGDGLSRSYVGNLFLVSGVESLPATRLYELWIEQKLLDGRLAVRVGQQGSDVEFIDSQYDDIFINSALGWPGITGANLPGGGPSPALAVPGIRIKASLTDRITGLSGAVRRFVCAAAGNRGPATLECRTASCSASMIRPGGSASSSTNSTSARASCRQRSPAVPGIT